MTASIWGAIFSISARSVTSTVTPNGGAESGREQVYPRLERNGPGIGDAGKLQRLVHFGDQLVDRHARPPFALRLEVDHGLEHLGRRRVGRGGGAARPAPDPGAPRERPD